MKFLNQITLVFVITFVLAAAAHGDGFTITSGSIGGNYITAVLTPDGRVLAVASSHDYETGQMTGAAVYNPATGTWTNTGNLNQAREGNTMTLLPNGKVLVTGGISFGAYTIHLGSSETYDPAKGTWAYSSGTTGYRYGHSATLLPNGKILFVGGEGDVGQGTLKSTELYDPATGSTTYPGSLRAARYFHTATLLKAGKVLVQGGGTNSAELYNPTNGTWTATGSPAHEGSFATLLPNGKVLILESVWTRYGPLPPSAELYDPTTGTWSPTSSPAGDGLTATLLPNGKVLVLESIVDPNNFSNPLPASAELYDPATGTWLPAPSPVLALYNTIAILLSNGQVLFNAELYQSSLNPILNPTKLGDGSIQFSFSNPSGPGYHILASPNLNAPLNTWSNLGAATEAPPGSGQFQFTDHQAPNYPRRFYRVISL